NLATTHTATSGNVQTAWTSNVTLPTWASESDGTYTVRAKATDKVGNTFTGSAVSFTLDKTLISPLNIGTANDTTGLPTLTQTATVPVGERIFVTVAMDAADPTTSAVTVNDSAGNTYAKDVDFRNGTDTSGVRTLVFSAPVITPLVGGTITVGFTGIATKAATFFSFNGLVSPSPQDKFHTATDGISNAPNSGSTLTTSQADELLIGAISFQDSTPNITAAAG